jgi:replicative DNA helicase
MPANYITAADSFDQWRDDLLTGTPPTLFPVADSGALARIEIGPGLVTLFGGPPGGGKTAFTMQSVVDALRLTPTLRVVVCNVEMSPSVLLDRQLARLSGIDAETIRRRQLDASHADRLDQGLATLEGIADRLCFVRSPFSLENVAAVADTFRADVLVLDYLQRIRPPGEHGDRRGSVDASMDYLRQFADAGVAVITVAAVARQKDSKGTSSYSADALNLASFRESSELEFGADDAFILAPDAKNAERVTLKHLKARHTEPRDIVLRFDRAHQSFAPDFTGTPNTRTKAGRMQAAIHELCNQTGTADDEDFR